MVKTNKEHIDSLNPQCRNQFIAFYAELESLGWQRIITRSYSTIAEQNALHTIDSRNSEGGFSAHNYGFATDNNFIKGKIHLKKATDIGIWLAFGIPQIAEKHGLRWGGTFKGYADTVHFDALKDPKCTTRWRTYLIKTYGTEYDKQKCNLKTWKL